MSEIAEFGSILEVALFGGALEVALFGGEAAMPTLTTPHSNTLIHFGPAGLTGGFSLYSYANTTISSTDVVSIDFWGGIRRSSLQPKDVIYCQLSDGFFKISMLTTTTGELV